MATVTQTTYQMHHTALQLVVLAHLHQNNKKESELTYINL